MRKEALLLFALASDACRSVVDSPESPNGGLSYDPDETPVPVDTDSEVAGSSTDSFDTADTDANLPVVLNLQTYQDAVDLCLNPFLLNYSACPMDSNGGFYPSDCMNAMTASNNDLIGALHPAVALYSTQNFGGIYDGQWMSFASRVGFDSSVVAYSMLGSDSSGNLLDGKTVLVTFGDQQLDSSHQSESNLHPNLPVDGSVSEPHHALGGLSCNVLYHPDKDGFELVRQVSLVQPDGSTAQFELQIRVDDEGLVLRTDTFEGTYPAHEWDGSWTHFMIRHMYGLAENIRVALPTQMSPVQDGNLSINASSGYFPPQ